MSSTCMRRRHKLGRLAQREYAAWESLPGWSWDARTRAAQQLLARDLCRVRALRSWVKAHGMLRSTDRCLESFHLGAYMKNARRRYREGTLAQEVVDALEAVPGWCWRTRSGKRP